LSEAASSVLSASLPRNGPARLPLEGLRKTCRLGRTPGGPRPATGCGAEASIFREKTASSASMSYRRGLPDAVDPNGRLIVEQQRKATKKKTPTEKFVGVDWGGAEHAVCVLDAAGRVKERFTIQHSDEGLKRLLTELRKHSRRSTLSIAIERPSGLLVDTLVQGGYRVVPIHPNAVKSFRARYTAAAGKDDRRDAYVLADVLRTDGLRFTELKPPSDETRAVRAASRCRDDFVEMRTALTNQLRSTLEGFWPAPLAMFPDLDALIALKFLEAFPTPESAKHLDERSLAKFLKENGYCNKRSAEELVTLLRKAPLGTNGPRETATKAAMVKVLAATLRTLVDQCKGLTRLVETTTEGHSDAAIMTSFPRIGAVTAAHLLAEIGDDRERFRSAEHLAAEAGVVPVTESSGKRSHKNQHRRGGKAPGVHFRWACNKRLRRAITCFADNSRHSSEWATSVYENARARGCAHNHAIRVLGRAWVRVLWRCWHDKKPYDPELHAGAKRAA
jgi:transposase